MLITIIKIINKRHAFANALILSGSLQYTPYGLWTRTTSASSMTSPMAMLPNNFNGARSGVTMCDNSVNRIAFVTGLMYRIDTLIWSDANESKIINENSIHAKIHLVNWTHVSCYIIINTTLVLTDGDPSRVSFWLIFFDTIFVSSHMYPENPEGTKVIVGSMNMGYISNTARNRTHNLFRSKQEPKPLGHSDGCFMWVPPCCARSAALLAGM